MNVLINSAIEAREFSYSPYSNFKVGAALLTKSGKIYTGCNVENEAYSPSNCAERTAFFKAVSEGELEFVAIAIVGNDINKPAYPCGVCRQVMSEFCNSDFKIYVKNNDEILEYTLDSILPYAFKGEVK